VVALKVLLQEKHLYLSVVAQVDGLAARILASVHQGHQHNFTELVSTVGAEPWVREDEQPLHREPALARLDALNCPVWPTELGGQFPLRQASAREGPTLRRRERAVPAEPVW
jgi:hypothetical protein